jgi:hypothetical protein
MNTLPIGINRMPTGLILAGLELTRATRTSKVKTITLTRSIKMHKIGRTTIRNLKVRNLGDKIKTPKSAPSPRCYIYAFTNPTKNS